MAKAFGSIGPPRRVKELYMRGQNIKTQSEIFLRFLQSVHHQKLDDKTLSFSAEVRKHALLECHIVVPDVQGSGSVILTSERRHAGQAAAQNLS